MAGLSIYGMVVVVDKGPHPPLAARVPQPQFIVLLFFFLSKDRSDGGEFWT